VSEKDRCKVCGRKLNYSFGRPKEYCEECFDYYRKEYKKKLNKDKIGNPEQDIKILRFIRKKRQ